MTDKIIKVEFVDFYYFTKESDHKAGRHVYHNDNDRPAVVYNNGDKYWLINGKCHRDNDQPAVIHANGAKHWYRNGQLHRDNDQPAVIHANGAKHWYLNGQRHRDNDQPAVIRADGRKEYWVNGIHVETPEEKDRKARAAWADKYM